MLNIDKLRHNWEKPFLDLMEGMERKIYPDNPHLTLWYKGDDWYFEQDEENGYLLCQYDRVWSVIEPNYSPEYTETQSIIRNLMERHYKLRGLTPSVIVANIAALMEKHYNLRELTPRSY